MNRKSPVLNHILTTLLLLQAGYAYVLYASIEAVIEQNKDQYFLAPAPYPEKHPQRCAGLAAPGDLFPAGFAATKTPPGSQARTEARTLTDLSLLALVALDQARVHGRVIN